MSTLIVTYVKKTTAQNEIGPGVLSSLLPLQQAAPILWPPDMKNWLIWKDCWCWERLKAGGEAGDRGWDGWMASPTRWTWVWASSGSWWRTGKPGVLQTMGSQRVGHDWATELKWKIKARKDRRRQEVILPPVTGKAGGRYSQAEPETVQLQEPSAQAERQSRDSLWTNP